MKSYLILPCLLLSACAGLPPTIGNAPAIQLSYNQVSRDINSYKDVPVRWGGVIIDVENEERSSLMQILFHPLDYRIPPTPPPTHTPSLMLQYPPVRTAAIHRFGC